MQSLDENLASKYATTVVDILTEDFPNLQDWRTRLMVIGHVRQHAENPDEPFEMCIDMTRHWRLHSETASYDRWRVLIHCHKDDWTSDDVHFVDDMNSRLRAISFEES